MPIEDFTDEFNQRAKFIADPVTWREARLDNLADALVVINYEHHEIHGGSSFIAEVHGTAAALNICFKTPPSGAQPHMTFNYHVPSLAHMQLLEGATWTTNTGTVYAPRNLNRNSSKVSTLLEDKTATPAFTANGVLLNATSPTGGTEILYIASVLNDTQQAGGGMELQGRHEVVLKADTQYAVVLTSDDGSKLMQLTIEFYEHEPTTPLV